jgi:DNA-binding CsgD family transcriptional regulator
MATTTKKTFVIPQCEQCTSKPLSVFNELELKNKTLTSYALQTVQDKKVLKDLYDQLKQIKKSPAKDRDEFLKTALADLKSTLQEENHWEEFKIFFETVHPQFIPNLQKIDASLSSAEIRLAVLLKMNMRSKDMATILRISPDSVRIARYRLRKKLPIEKGEDLIQYILNI